MKVAPLLCLVLAGLARLAAAGADGPMVDAAGERLLGAWTGEREEIAVFRGIPFAAPPTGKNRWRAPQPPIARAGVQEALEFAPSCMQGNHTVLWYGNLARHLGADPSDVGRANGSSEDCLYLNVWTAQPGGAADLPVMVWVHGGRNAGGWSYEPNSLGERVAGRGAVVVTIAYRLGPFGFFSHPKLDNGPGQPISNFGWLDMAQALRWVKSNVASFGGDPNNMTLVGESSGAANLLDFAAQDLARELGLQRLILQSMPNPFYPRRNLLEEMEIGKQMVAFLGIDARMVTPDRLRAIPAEDVLHAAEAVRPDAYYDTVKDALRFLQTPREALRKPLIGQWDLLIGSNADEWRMDLDETTSEADVAHWFHQNARDSVALLEPLVMKGVSARRALNRLYSAKELVCPSEYLAERVTAAGGRAWMYYFSRQRPGAGGAAVGAYHGAEIAYVFDQHQAWQPTDERDRELTEAVMDYWVAFARNGDPNGSGRPAWPRYRTAEPQVLELGDQVRVIAPPDLDLCLWLGPGRGAKR